IARDAFDKRYAAIAEEMTLTGVRVGVGVATPEQDASNKPVDGRTAVALNVHYATTNVDPFDRAVTLLLVRQPDRTWKVEWSPETILPALSGERLVRMTRLAPTRGR